jgi:hypothetical protein
MADIGARLITERRLATTHIESERLRRQAATMAPVSAR